MSNIWFRWVKSILNTCDNPDGQITLFRKGVVTAYIQWQTRVYWMVKDVVHVLKWERYPEPSGYDENGNHYYLLWYGDIAIVFDDFDESWIWYEKERGRIKWKK